MDLQRKLDDLITLKRSSEFQLRDLRVSGSPEQIKRSEDSDQLILYEISKVYKQMDDAGIKKSFSRSDFIESVDPHSSFAIFKINK